MRTVTRLKRLAGIAGRIAAPLCKKSAYRLFLLVSSARLRTRPQIWVRREGMIVPEVHNFICAHMWMQVGAGHAFSISRYHMHLCICGWTTSIVPGHICDCPYLDDSVLSHLQALGCFVNINFISSLQERRCYPINGVCRRP